jgi:hypothetical protein
MTVYMDFCMQKLMDGDCQVSFITKVTSGISVYEMSSQLCNHMRESSMMVSLPRQTSIRHHTYAKVTDPASTNIISAICKC